MRALKKRKKDINIKENIEKILKKVNSAIKHMRGFACPSRDSNPGPRTLG